MRLVVVFASACQGPPRLESRCVGAWPQEVSAPTRPALKVTPGIAWQKTVSRASSSDGLVMTRDVIAISVGARLALLDHEGQAAGDRISSGYERISSPVADPEGRLYFAGAGIYAVDPKVGFRWITPLSAQSGSTLVLSPGGVLFAATADGALSAVASDDGRLLWRREIGTKAQETPPVRGGVGDAVLVVANAGTDAAQLFDTASGLPLARWSTRGAFFGAELGLVTQRMEPSSGPYPWMHVRVLDRCSNLRFEIPPTRPQWPSLIGPGDRLLVAERDDTEGSPVHVTVYGPEGTRLAGPVLAAVPWAMGADGTLYGVRCEGPGWDGPTKLFAYDEGLAEKWRLDLGAGCPTAGPALSDEGLLVFARFLPESSVTEVVAIRTESPGLAASSWPIRRHDNHGTGWLR